MNPFGLFGIAAIAAGLSARWNWWRVPRKGIPCLMYHKIGNPPADSQLKKLWVSVEKFRGQMNYLKKNGYTPIIFKDLYAFWDKQKPLPEKPVLITFDDGYKNNYELGYSVLKEFGFPATLFVVVQTVGGENQWHDPKSEARIDMITWDQLKELKKAGWEIGSHTMTHRNLQKIDLNEVAAEVTKSRQVLGEFLNEIPDTFAYPYGSGADNQPIREKTRDAGYRVAVSVHPGKWDSDEFKERPFEIPRIFVRGEENIYDFHLQMTRGQSRL